MPVDPQGEGTWIATNLHGMTLCLLNNYQKQAEMNPDLTYLSRGKLIPELVCTSNSINTELEQLSLENYMPFFLCVFPGNLNKSTHSISIFQWDGDQLTQEQAEQPFISSGVFLHQVQKARRDTFTKIIADSANTQMHLAYHASHLPEKNHASVCMHRKDAHTHSLSHISVNDEVTFRYHDGAPCQNNRWSELKYKRLKLTESPI